MYASPRLAFQPEFLTRNRLTFYAVALPLVLFWVGVASHTHACLSQASLINGHDPVLSTPAELGFSWLANAKHNLSNIPPYPGYKSLL